MSTNGTKNGIKKLWNGTKNASRKCSLGFNRFSPITFSLLSLEQKKNYFSKAKFLSLVQYIFIVNLFDEHKDWKVHQKN